MCGIIGYIGEKTAAPILIEGLKRLEYRGYDSAGLSTILEGKRLAVRRALGKVSALEKSLEASPLEGTLGIAHTRWATHGAPSERNAHPHCSESVSVVHNGIIENHETLRSILLSEGYEFESDTDTEVLPHLIMRALKAGAKSLEDAVASALSHVEGAYAIAVLSSGEQDRLIAACHSSPLVIGIGERELYLASDELALAGKVDAVVHVKDGEVVTLKRNGTYSFRGIPLSEVESRKEAPTVAEGDAQKGGYTHFMLKEIHDQPQAMRNVLAGRLREGHSVVFGGLTPDIEARLRDTRRIVLAACGTSLFASMAGAQLIEKLCGVIAVAEQAAEFAYREPELSSADTVIGISQSGETADTLRALDIGRERHSLVLGITNRVGSSLARKARAGLYLHAGPEIAVASTKAFTAQVAALALFAVKVAQLRGRQEDAALRRDLLRLPELVADSLKREEEMRALAEKIAFSKRLIIIGRGYGVPLALEAALKVREIAYIDAHGLSASELKHGTLALVEKGTPVVAIMPHGEQRTKMLSNVEEVRARGGDVFLLESPEGVSEALAPVVLAAPLQLMAYYLGVARGVDVDQPRNLAKSVTVE
jgi:glucosamine--fructose-6-phosphate aminotransferase (isomerizing)